MRIIRKFGCPHCGTINSVGLGVVGTYCENCGTYFLLEGRISEQPWKPNDFFDRLVERFSTPRSIIASSIILLVLFVGFWGFLHFEFNRSSKPAVISAPIAVNESPSVDQTPPAMTAVPPPPPVTTAPATRPEVVAVAPAAPTVPAAPAAPIPHPVLPGPVALTDAQVGEAIRRGAHYLIDNFDPTTHAIRGDPSMAHGMNALCVYALLQCNDAINDPDLAPASDFMGPVLETLKSQPMEEHDEIYGRSLRASALALIDRAADRKVLESDVRWLENASRNGAYTYNMPTGPVESQGAVWDNSNSQYGLLGVWAGAEVGISVPHSYWVAVQNHWASCQIADGSYQYQQGYAPTVSMTAAGLASLGIVQDALAEPAKPGVDLRPPALIKALNWINQGDNVLNDAAAPHFGSYTRYAIARAGLELGYKYFGKHDWYTELAAPRLQNQAKDGSFGDSIDTAFTLLFLARGRHPILFNKLSISGVTLDHPRDISNLARYVSRELEHTFNSQIVPLTADWSQWTESPVLYMTAAWAPFVTDGQCDQLRNFVRAGGLLFTHADGNSRLFNAFAQKLAQRLFPEYPYQELPSDHPLYTALFKLDPRPPLLGVSNGVRLLMVNSPRDLASSWDLHDWQKVEPVYRLGLNIFVYAAGDRDFRNRLDTQTVQVPDAKPDVTLNVARVRYAGNWDPEPFAWTRLGRLFQWKTSFAINLQPTDVKNLSAHLTPIADLTGIEAHQFSADEIAVMQRYVREGGLLLIDSCGGAPGFASSQPALLAALAPDAQPRIMVANHPLVNGKGACMVPLPEVLPRVAGARPQPPKILNLGRGHIIITPIDLTNALLGSRMMGMTGYSPTFAEPFLQNLLLWDYNGQPDR